MPVWLSHVTQPGCGAGSFLTEALAKVCLFVDEDFGRNHVSERHEHLENVLVSELLRQVVDEQVGAFRTWRSEPGGRKVRTAADRRKLLDLFSVFSHSLLFYIHPDSPVLGHGFQTHHIHASFTVIKYAVCC